MEFFKKIFNKGRKAIHIPTRYEQIELDRLRREECYCEYKDKEVYFYDNELTKVKVLGKYSYYDVYGTVSNIVAQKDNGEIVTVGRQILFIRKPHDWVKYLNNKEKYNYSRMQRWAADEELANTYIPTLDKTVIKAVKRDIKLNSLLNG